MNENSDKVIHGVILAVLIVAAGWGTFRGRAILRAEAFRQLTGVQVTAWQAMWVDLQVVGLVKEK